VIKTITGHSGRFLRSSAARGLMGKIPPPDGGNISQGRMALGARMISAGRGGVNLNFSSLKSGAAKALPWSSDGEASLPGSGGGGRRFRKWTRGARPSQRLKILFLKLIAWGLASRGGGGAPIGKTGGNAEERRRGGRRGREVG